MAKTKPTSILARLDDGTIQLTITIPNKTVQGKKERVLTKLASQVEIPGFRKGKVPRHLAIQKIDPEELFRATLQELLPDAYASAVEEHKLSPILAPRFEIVSAEDNKDWSIRATTCELPTVDVGDYKKTIAGELKSGKIWVPGKKDGDKEKEETREEKEQNLLNAIIKNVKVKIPQVLVDEEVNHRLAKLLDQTQRLGITVEQYLSSTAKTLEQLKEQYAREAKEAITLELGLNQIAEAEGVTVHKGEIEEVIATSGTESAKSTPQQKQLIRNVLMRRKALDRLSSLA